MNTFSLVIHVIAATVLVGPQLLLFFAVVPATWLIPDEQLRRDVTRVVTARFGMLAGVSLVLLVITGLYQFYSSVPAGIRDDMLDYRFGSIFMFKMILLVAFVALLAFHVRVTARRIGRLSDRVIADPSDDDAAFALDAQRRTSFVLSLMMLLVSVGMLVLGAMLGDHGYSYTQR